MAKYGKKIAEDLELCKFDGVTETSVYVGSLCDLVPAKVKWRETGYSKITETDLDFLKLSEIVEQLNQAMLITVIVNSALHGEIYQYGNYGNEWWCIGETMGYA